MGSQARRLWLSLVVRHHVRMSSLSKPDRWHLFIAVTLVVNVAPFVGTTITVPPRGLEYRMEVLRAVAFFLVPFAWSVFLLFRCRTSRERVVAYSSLAISFFWLCGAAVVASKFYDA